jgi:hypothetical protein
MALTLVEASKIAMGKDQILRATIMELYARGSELTAAIPFDDIAGASETFLREKTLPGVAFRKVNAGYIESTGETDRITEPLAIAGGDLDVDKFLVDTGGVNQRSIQEQMKIKALSLNIAKTVIKGDITTIPESFDGLQARVLGDQRIDAGTTASGDNLSLVKLDEAIDACEDPTHLIMNKTMRRRMSAGARVSTVGGYITYELDAFGRRVTKYNDLPILLVDKDETNTDIMAFSELAGTGVGTVCTSIYCCSFVDDGVVGLQNGVMDVRDLGEIESKPVFRTRIEWYITLAMRRPRSASRLRGITNAAITA